MRGPFLMVGLMIIAAMMMGCGETLIPCSTDADCAFDPGGWDLDAAQGPPMYDAMICNEAISVEARCNELTGYLPDFVPLPDVCKYLPDFGHMGTCQVPGGEGAVCAEDLDCQEGLACNVDGVCA
jgi:hypothetical protein